MVTTGFRQTLRAHVVVASAVVWACVAATAGAQEDPLLAHAYAGEVDDDLFIGVLVADDPADEGRQALIVYLCDGADVSTWLFGDATPGATVLEANGARVEVLLGHDGVAGVVERTGEAPRSFEARRTNAEAGLFRAVATFDGSDYVGGWIVLDDGRQRGAITLGGIVVENPQLDPVSGEAHTSLGTFGSNCFINPHTGERICRYLN